MSWTDELKRMVSDTGELFKDKSKRELLTSAVALIAGVGGVLWMVGKRDKSAPIWPYLLTAGVSGVAFILWRYIQEQTRVFEDVAEDSKRLEQSCVKLTESLKAYEQYLSSLVSDHVFFSADSIEPLTKYTKDMIQILSACRLGFVTEFEATDVE